MGKIPDYETVTHSEISFADALDKSRISTACSNIIVGYYLTDVKSSISAQYRGDIFLRFLIYSKVNLGQNNIRALF